MHQAPCRLPLTRVGRSCLLRSLKVFEMGPKKAPVGPKGTRQTGKNVKHKIPKKSIPTAERLKRLFTSLCAQIEGGHFSNAIKTCDKSEQHKFYINTYTDQCLVLRIDPKDQDAIQTNLFLLLQTDRYSDALDLIGDQDNQAFEKVYSLYRLHREEDVTDVLEAIKRERGGDDRGANHLEAQLASPPLPSSNSHTF